MVRVLRFIGLGVLILVGLLSVQLLNATPTKAATINDLQVSCTQTTVTGNTEVAAKYIRIQVVLGSNLTNVLATKIVSVRHRAGAKYAAVVNYPQQPEGTLLVVSVGEWNGKSYVRPATIVGRNCGQSNVTPTPLPTATIPPVPTNTATAPSEYINYFTADQTVIPAGGCVTLYWHVVGAQQVTLLGSNWPNQTPTTVNNPDQTTVCPSAAGNYVPGQPVTYTLTAHYLSGGIESRSITITYDSTPVPSATPVPTGTVPAPEYINYFMADQTVIPAGGCVTLYWHVVGAQQVTLLGSNWPNQTPTTVNNPDQTTVCPSAAGNYVPGQPVTYTLTAHYLSGGVESRSITVTYQ